MAHCGRTNSPAFVRPVDLSLEIVTESFKGFLMTGSRALLPSIDRSYDDVPLKGNVFVAQIVVIPTLADRAFKTAIVSGFAPR
jgi:hypothetical protein